MPVITITISIDVPAGSGVHVAQGNGAATPDRPFVQRGDPPEPDGYCPVHDVNWHLVPSGVSKKTGKQYNSFYACPERGCNEKPGRVIEDLSDPF